MPKSYWLGRICALSDHFRTEEMSYSPGDLTFSSSDKPPASFAGSLFEGLQSEEHCNDCSFVSLENSCMTAKAQLSLIDFSVEYKKRIQLELLWEKDGRRTVMTKDKENNRAGMAVGVVKAKLSVMERFGMRKLKSERKSKVGTEFGE